MLFQQPLAEPVKLAGRHAGFCGVEHVLQGHRDNFANALECDDVVLGFDGHGSRGD